MYLTRVLLGLGAVFAVVVGAIAWALLASRPATTQVQYASAAVRRGAVAETLTATGTLAAADVVQVTPGVAGQIASLPTVAVGSTVTAGQVLATLTNPQLTQAVATDQRNVAQAKLNLQIAQDSSAVATAGLAVQQAQQHVTVAQQNLQAAQTALTAAQAALAQAQAQAAELTVRAPAAGIVRGLALMPGESVGSGAPVAMVASTHWLAVTLELPQTAIPQLAVGQPLTAASNGVVAGGQLTGIGSAAARVQDNVAYLPVTGQVQWVAGLAPGMDVVVETGPTSVVGGTSTPADTADGTLQYLNREAVVPGVGGTVTALVVADHAPVAADAPLLLLSNPTLQEAVTKAQAAVEQAQQQVTDDQVAVTDAQAALALAQTGAGGAALQSGAALAAAESQVQTEEAALANDATSLAALTVRSPVGGRIASVTATPGAQVGAQSTLFTLVAPGSLNLVLQVPQSNIDQIHLGQAATVTSDAVPGQSFPALVSAEAPVGVDTNGITNFNVTLSLQQGGGLLPGMAADAAITLKSVRAALLVPLEAVHGIGIGSGTVALPANPAKGGKSGKAGRGTGGAWVAVLRSGGTFAKVPVVLGINNGLDVQVTSGLTAGERIVTSDLAELTPQTKLSLLGRIFHRAPQRTAGATAKGGVKSGARGKAKTPVRRALPPAKAKG